MKKGICYIVGAGENYGIDFTPNAADYVIAADGGFLHLEKKGIIADLVIGDFDSLGYTPKHDNVILLNKEKDETDTFCAMQAGISKGYTTFSLYCCMGGRLEHSLANIQLLAYLSNNGMRGFLHDQKNILTSITNDSINFCACDDGYVSVFSMTDRSCGVDIKGLKYPLDKAELTNAMPLGISNEFVGGESVISVDDGTLLVIYPKKKTYERLLI